MMYRLVFDKEAEAEFADAFEWHELRREGLGAEFEAAIYEALERLASTPEHYSFTDKGFRQMAVKRFRYVIAFRISETQQTIYVSSVFHTSRDPQGKFREPE